LSEGDRGGGKREKKKRGKGKKRKEKNLADLYGRPMSSVRETRKRGVYKEEGEERKKKK